MKSTLDVILLSVYRLQRVIPELGIKEAKCRLTTLDLSPGSLMERLASSRACLVQNSSNYFLNLTRFESGDPLSKFGLSGLSKFPFCL